MRATRSPGAYPLRPPTARRARAARAPRVVVGYAPAANTNGSDSFVVQVSDGNGGTDTITVNVTIQAVNDAPTCQGVNLTTNEDTAGEVSPNCSDVDGDTLTYLAAPAGHGSSQVVGSKLTYTPNLNYNGTDSFQYKANDGTVDSNIATVNVTVTAVNDPPVITGQAPLATDEDTPLAIVLGNLTVTDVDNTYPDNFSLTVLAGSNYTFVGATITPAANFNGTLTVPVKVNDGAADSNTYDLTVTVNPVNDAPAVTNPGDQTNADGDIVSLQVAASDVDVPADTLSYAATGLPAGLIINTTDGLIAGTLVSTASANSPYNATITVSDGNGGSTAVNFTWTVNPASGPCESDDPDLVGCWLFDEGSGTTTADGSGEDNTGTLYDSTMWTADRFGNARRALHFNGNSQYVKVADADSLDIVGDITIAAWVRPEQVLTQDVVKKAVTTGTYVGGYELALSSSSGNCAVSGGVVPCAFARFNATSAAPDSYRVDTKDPTYSATDPWTFYVVTYTGADNTLRIYRNGSLSNSRIPASALTIASNDLFLGFGAQLAGTGPTASRWFKGSLDDIRIYKRALACRTSRRWPASTERR